MQVHFIQKKKLCFQLNLLQPNENNLGYLITRLTWRNEDKMKYITFNFLVQDYMSR